MNKTFTLSKYFLIALIITLFTQNNVKAQCNTTIAAVRDTIACGESIFLQQVGVGGASSDDFTGSTLSGLWQSVSAGWVIGGPCGSNPNGGQHLWFAQGSTVPRTATTVPVDASCGGNICFDFRQETQSPQPCDGPDLAPEGVYLQYKTAGGAWTTIHYFSPVGFPYVGWQNHCFPIPAAAQTPTTQFRWQQTTASGSSWDLWGIDNVNIATCSGFSSLWDGGSLTGYTLDTATVSPTITTTYSVLYSDSLGTSSCSDTITIYVEQPSIIASVLSSVCSGSDTLDAQATITANCEYELELWNYLPGGVSQNGWNAGGSPPQYHNVDINVNGSILSNYTMITGGQASSVSYQLPVTDGDVLEAIFTNWGNAANECMYRIYDSQGTLLITQGFPGSVPGNVTATLGNAINVSCPATATYVYSWYNITSGGVGGLNDPNVQNPLATVAVTTQFEVTASDSLNPACIAIDTVTVQPNANAITATMSSLDTLICNGDPVVLDFLLSGAAPWGLSLDVNGSIQNFSLDNFGFINGGGGPVTFNPTTTTTYSVLSLADSSGCPASVTNPAITVNVSQPPNAGGPGVATFCTSDPLTYDLSTYLTGTPDVDGVWTDPNGITTTPPAGSASFIFDPQTMVAGNYTYTVDNPPCLLDFSNVVISLIPPPNAGVSPGNQIVCANDPGVDLSTLLGTPDPDGVWTDPNGITTTPPAGSASFIFDPSTNATGNYTYTVTDPTGFCGPASSTINISINQLPTVNIGTSNNNICLGQSSNLTFTLIGAAPFNLTYSPSGGAPVNVILDAFGNDLFGNPVSVSPINTTTYSIISIQDANNCVNISNSTITINVNAPPNAGVSSNLSVCGDDISLYPLQNQLGGGQDLTGYWTVPPSTQLPNNPNFDFNPQTMIAGNYTYTVSAAPCPYATATVTVSLITPPFSGIPNPASICENAYSAANPFDLNTLLVGADPGGIWLDPSGNPIAPTIDPATYGVGVSGFTYEVFGVPPCLNSQTNVNLTINPEPIINTFTGNPLIISQGNNTNLTVDMTSGTPPFTINLSDNDTPPNNPSIVIVPPNMQGSISVSPNVIPITTYVITGISDANGCLANSNLSVNIDVEPYPVIDPFTTATATVCEGDPVSVQMVLDQGEAPVTVNYTYNGVNYSEIIGVAGQPCPILVSVPLDITNLNIGTNTITITDVTDASGTTSPINELPLPVSVTINPLPNITFTTLTPEICFESPATLDFGFLIGTPPFNIDYTINAAPQTPLVINGSGNQSYTISPDPVVGLNTYNIITVTDANGCSVNNPVSPVDIIVNPKPDLNIVVSGTNPICYGQSSELFFPVFSGTAPFNLDWIDDNGGSGTHNVDAAGNILSTGLPLPVSPLSTTTYSIISVADDKGCVSSLNESATLVVNELPIVTVTGNAEICDGDVTQLYFNFSSGSGPWTVDYTVNGNPQVLPPTINSFDSLAINPNISSVYSFNSVSDANCSNSANDVITISVNPLPEASLSGGGSLCDDGSTADIVITTLGGTPTFNVMYSIGIDNRIVSNVGYQHVISTNEQGIYSLISVTDSKGCNALNLSGTANINVNPMPIASFSAYPQPANINNPVITFENTSYNNYSNWIWNFGDLSNTTIDSTTIGKVLHAYPSDTAGSYIASLQVETDSGCIDIATQIIVIDDAFKIYIPDAFTPNNDLRNDHFLPIVAGVKKYEFIIYNRFGQRIFTTESYTDSYCVTGCNEAWDGKVQGKEEFATSGHYAYSIILTDIYGKKRRFDGTLTLIR